MQVTIKQAVSVDMRAGGEDLSGAWEPGDHELPEPVAEVLIAAGIATPTKSKSSKPKVEEA